MIIERHKLIGHMPIKRRVPKITKIEPSNNGADMDDSNCPDKLEPVLYDTIITYCVSCKTRIEFPVVHDKATNNSFQLVNIPDHVADEVHEQKIYCKQCRNTNLLEKQKQVTNLNVFTLKLDCSNMNPGTEDWYEDFSSSSGDGHPRKF
ncbi:uncharacterized protein METZ01_LOCUS115068 [marine metagenome]|uniref:Uncharacterized protein n=1 Tax=marine metagenome TaxID=408172 RepID=A0A381XBW3_9ZZZZ